MVVPNGTSGARDLGRMPIMYGAANRPSRARAALPTP